MLLLIVNSEYLVNDQTMALIPGYNLDYEAIAVEEEKSVYCRKDGFSLIKETLLSYYASYEDRKRIIRGQTGFVKKVPMPIDLFKIYMFPTDAVNHFDCYWISYRHVRKIEKDTDPKKSIIHFINGQTLKVPATQYSLNEQLKRSKVIRRHCEKTTGINLDNFFNDEQSED
jgi:competence transcription factor ComK